MKSFLFRLPDGDFEVYGPFTPDKALREFREANPDLAKAKMTEFKEPGFTYAWKIAA